MTHLFASDVLFKYGGFWLPAKEAEQRGFKMEQFFVPESGFIIVSVLSEQIGLTFCASK